MSDRRFGAVISWPRGLVYAVVAVVAGLVVSELAAMLIFAGSSDRRLDEQAVRSADSSPAVVAASAELDSARQSRTALDDAVAQASRARDEALVVARCEFSAAPGCPQTRITGVPGAGPEHGTADAFLADTQRELDRAEAERNRLAPTLDAAIAADEGAVTAARDAAIASVDRGFGARWTAMNAHTLDSAGAVVLRALLAGVFVLLCLAPLLFRISRAKSTEDRRTAAAAERDRAELDADTAIAVKRAEVRAAVETMRAEQELESARLAMAAQAEIDREEQRRRVAAVLEAPTPVISERVEEVDVAVDPQLALPAAQSDEPANLPAVRETRPAKRSVIPVVPEVAEAAARWMRPFVPPIIASAIDTTTRPLRAARESFEETEEIHFSLRRSHRVTVTSEETVEPGAPDAPSEPAVTASAAKRVTASRAVPVERAATVAVERPTTTRKVIRTGDGQRELPPAP